MKSEDLKNEQIVLENTINKIKDQTYYVWELLEKKKGNFNKGINDTGDDVAYRRGMLDKELLRKAEKEPFFGSFDINSEEEGNETFYIGKQGVRDQNENVIVVDWRMPIASVFYNFTPSQPRQSYMVHDERARRNLSYSVDVLKKKEFTIKDKKIIKIIQQVSDELNDKLNVTITENGEELTITDDFLREIIEHSETTGYLKEIIASIQKEQDIAIRQPIDRNVIIQGVAGSGKSSIALHRLSYLLYNNKNIKPSEVLILGPSNLFISSVKELLPNLNLEGIKQSTVQQLLYHYIKSALQEKIDLSYNQYFEKVLFSKNQDQTRQIIEFKGSESFTVLLDIFVSELKDQYENKIQPITILTEHLSKEALLEIYNGYKYLPFSNKVERFRQHVENHFRRITEGKVKEIKEHYDFVVQTYLKNGGLNQSDYDNLVKKMQGIMDYKTKKVRNEFITEITTWKNSMKEPDLLSIYKQVLSFEVLSAFEHELGPDIPKLFKNFKIQNLTYFDLAPLFYIYLLLFDKPEQFSHIVIDEGQDLSYVHYAALKKITKTMTILGDKDQSIFMNFGQYDWTKLSKSLFHSKQEMILTLDTSYRSTTEIIDVANKVLINQNGILHTPIIPLNRSGEKVSFDMVQSGKDLLESIVQTLKVWRKKYKRIAIIHKDEQRAKKLAQYLSQEYYRDIVYMSPEDDMVNKSITVLTSYYSKGMEFDAVILCNINKESFPKDDLHARILYVLLTRAQQEVKVFYQDTPSALLEGLIEEVPKRTSVFDDIL
ncbi:HelD family protein [Neobacillus drentensis]|uniref:HelD family protein n=1 Tax=Neobacillus drentensis TaxID=220684 RepID=UPI0008254E1C|nr:3'-5' exonuclease [Neobacillus drentensis]